MQGVLRHIAQTAAAAVCARLFLVDKNRRGSTELTEGWRDVAFIGMLIGLVLAFFWPEVTLRSVFNYQFDNSLIHYSIRSALAEALRRGTIPLWTPYISAGFPLYAQPETAAFYPLNWVLYGLLPTYAAHNYTVILLFAMAGVFTYLYARRSGLRSSSALLASLTFMGGGGLMGSMDHFQNIEPVVWLPVLFLLAERIIQTRRLIYALLAGVVMALQLLAGFPQTAFLSVVGVSVYFYIRVFGRTGTVRDISHCRGEKRAFGRIARTLFHCTVLWLAAGATSLLLAAVQLLPTWEYISQSPRAGGAGQIGISLAPWELLTFLVPYAFSIVKRLSQGAEVMTYVGILPLFFALMAMLSVFVNQKQAAARDKQESVFVNQKLIVAFIVVLTFSLLFALGSYTPFYGLIRKLPGFHLFRNPNRILFLTSFSLAMLVGFGFEVLSVGEWTIQQQVRTGDSPGQRTETARWASRLAQALAVLGAVLAVGILVGGVTFALGQDFILAQAQEYFITRGGGDLSLDHYLHRIEAIYWGIRREFHPLSPRYAAPVYVLSASAALLGCRLRKWLSNHLFRWLSVVLVAADLAVFAYAAEPERSLPRAVYLAEPDALSFLHADSQLYRVFSPFSWERQYNLLYEGAWGDLHRLRLDLLLPNLSLPYHIAHLDGYFGLRTTRSAQMHYFFHPDAPGKAADGARLALLVDHAKLLGVLNVKYVLSPQRIDSPDFILRYQNRIKVYENQRFMPRAFVVPKAEVIEDENEVFEALTRLEFDPRQYVILGKQPPPGWDKQRRTACKRSDVRAFFQPADIIEYTDTRVVIHANLPDRGFLVLTDTFYPGWRATVDAKEVEIYQANYHFRAIPLEKGTHEVIFTFEPRYLRLGAWTSSLTLCTVLVYIGFDLARRWLAAKGIEEQ